MVNESLSQYSSLYTTVVVRRLSLSMLLAENTSQPEVYLFRCDEVMYWDNGAWVDPLQRGTNTLDIYLD